MDIDARLTLRFHVRNHGQHAGINREALASAIGRDRLNPNDLAQIDLLADQGMIRIDTASTARPHILEYRYIAIA